TEALGEERARRTRAADDQHPHDLSVSPAAASTATLPPRTPVRGPPVPSPGGRGQCASRGHGVPARGLPHPRKLPRKRPTASGTLLDWVGSASKERPYGVKGESRGRSARAAHGCARPARRLGDRGRDRKSTRLNSSHVKISYAVF